MKIIVDESLGISSDLMLEQDVVIRKARLKKDGSLQETLSNERNHLIPRKIELHKGDLQTELEEIHSYLDQYGDVFYVYDSIVNDEGLLKRISNWNYPKRKLFLFDGATNRAFTAYVLKMLQLHSFEDVYRMSGRNDHLIFTIINDNKYQQPSHYLQLKTRKQEKYHLFNGTTQQKMGSGTKELLVDEVLSSVPTGTILVAARTPLPPGKREVDFYRLEEVSLPISSDRIDIFIPS